MIISRRCFMAIGCAAIVCSAVAQAEVIDRIVVVVNTEVITQREIDRILEPVYEQFRGLYVGDELVSKINAARAKILDQLIEDRLILSEAKRLNVEVPDKEVEARLADAQGQFKTKEEFEKALAAQSLTVKELRSSYKEQSMVRKLVGQKVGAKVAISPSEVEEYYRTHTNDFVMPESVILRAILIRPKDDTDAGRALETAKEIFARLQEGGDFAGLAKEYSDGPNASEGGLMGDVKKGDLLPEIESAVFALKEQEISDILQTSIGYHIFKVETKRERKALSLAEASNKVEEIIFRDKIKGKIRGWVESLKKNAYISYR